MKSDPPLFTLGEISMGCMGCLESSKLVFLQAQALICFLSRLMMMLHLSFIYHFFKVLLLH